MAQQYNEKTLPILKYLRWRQPLANHPDFLKARKKAMTRNPSDFHSESPYPILWPKSLPLNDPKNLYLINANDAVFGLSRVWPEFAEAASSKIEALSKTFVSAMESSYEAFLKPELFKELEDQDLQGTLIFPGGKVICYDFIMESPEEKDGKLTYLVNGNAIYLNEGRYLVCDNFEDYDENRQPLGTTSWHDFETMECKVPDQTRKDGKTIGEQLGVELEITDGVNKNVLGMFDCILVYHLFKKYAPIEEIVSVRERREHKDLPDIKTSQRIEFYDCGWYTTIVRNEGFSVKGHFRLQPCGTGRHQRKLIYIREFQKHGYVRRARLLLNEDKNDQ